MTFARWISILPSTIKSLFRVKLTIDCKISILPSTIKSGLTLLYPRIFYLISILPSTIKSYQGEVHLHVTNIFQFYQVRLKVSALYDAQKRLNKFQFYQVRLKVISVPYQEQQIEFQFYQVRLKVILFKNRFCLYKHFNSTKYD